MRTRAIRTGRADSFAYAAPAATAALVEAAGLTTEEAEQAIGVPLDVMGRSPSPIWCRYADLICDAGLAKKTAQQPAA